MPGQVTDHDLIIFKLIGRIALRNTFCTFRSLTTLKVILSLNSDLFGVPLIPLIFVRRPRGDF